MRNKCPVEMRKCLTPKFRVSFPSAFKPEQYEDQEPKFSLTMLFDKSTDLSALKKVVMAAALAEFGDKSTWPKNLRFPFRDGSEKPDLQGYEGCVFVRATSLSRPGIVDQKREPITEQSGDFYPGCYARATLIASAYDVKGNRGVKFILQNIQKLADGEAFSGRPSAESEFDAVDMPESATDFDSDDDFDI